MGIGWIAHGHHDPSPHWNCQNSSSFSLSHKQASSYELFLCIDAIFKTILQTTVCLVLDDLRIIDIYCHLSLNCPLKNANSPSIFKQWEAHSFPMSKRMNSVDLSEVQHDGDHTEALNRAHLKQGADFSSSTLICKFWTCHLKPFVRSPESCRNTCEHKCQQARSSLAEPRIPTPDHCS